MLRDEAPERYVGSEIYDPLVQKIGCMERLFVNGDGEPVYVRVRMGMFRLKSALLPVGRMTVEEEEPSCYGRERLAKVLFENKQHELYKEKVLDLLFRLRFL